ncbi:MAG: hypothetical protein MRJ96_14075 [Nitrospirales bacterium]|nr:hypothetical protein [Nitrospira sp.]MDR4502572.1 hypothetical protein [Nitrospirales bacterium]
MNRQLFVSQVICLLAISLPLASCLALPQVETPIHESSRGRIILKTFPEGFNHASHPSPISLLSIQDILHGLRIQEDKALLATLVSGEGQVLPVFSEEDLEFFGPFIHDALSQATSEEYVEFERRKPQAIPPTLTRGTLYMTNASAHIGLDKFQADMRQKEVSSKASFSPTRIKRWILQFYPSEVARTDASTQDGTLPLYSDIGSLTIDLEAFRSTREDSSSGIDTEEDPLRANDKSKDMRAIEEEIEELQQQLEGQHRELDRLKDRLRQKDHGGK